MLYIQEISKKYFNQMIPFEIDQLNLAIGLNNPHDIKKYLFRLLPSCHKGCESCQYKESCKYNLTKDLQQKAVESFPEYFKLKKRYI
jgi:hypothetical protein